MKFIVLCLAVLLFCAGCQQTADRTEQLNSSKEEISMSHALSIGNVTLRWLGQSGFAISNKVLIYIDPFRMSETNQADLILITHAHFDHCSPDDVKKIATEKTIIVAPADCLSTLGAVKGTKKTIAPGMSLNVSGIAIDAVPAYNIGKSYHPQANGWVGFIITIDGKRIYHAGDTDRIPEMSHIKNIDIALLPVGGTYTMDAREAAEAASLIKPALAVPMHYGSAAGSPQDGEKFKNAYSGETKVL
jgi:L-ascorbate metabolism protein UlaG (beta-lactamase superfamily)